MLALAMLPVVSRHQRSMAGFAGEEIEQLWHEYEAGMTPAAQLVKDFDKARRQRVPGISHLSSDCCGDHRLCC